LSLRLFHPLKGIPRDPDTTFRASVAVITRTTLISTRKVPINVLGPTASPPRKYPMIRRIDVFKDAKSFPVGSRDRACYMRFQLDLLRAEFPLAKVHGNAKKNEGAPPTVGGSSAGATLRRFSLAVAPRFLWECLSGQVQPRIPSTFTIK
jgi:hypothetical protein